MALQLSNGPLLTVEPGVSPLPRLDLISGTGVYRARQVHVGFGGRISVSWQAMLASSSSHRCEEVTKAKVAGGTSMLGNGDVGDSGQQPSGYSWAIVRTRGGDDTSGGDLGVTCAGPSPPPPLPPRVIHQGFVRTGRMNTNQNQHGIIETVKGSNRSVDGKTDTAFNPSVAAAAATSASYHCKPYSSASAISAASFSPSSPWQWQEFQADTSGWQPGDVLSLWIRVDTQPPRRWPSSTGDYRDRNSLDHIEIMRGRRLGYSVGVRDGDEVSANVLSFSPRVRGFELRAVDDARVEETVHRAACCPYDWRTDNCGMRNVEQNKKGRKLRSRIVGPRGKAECRGEEKATGAVRLDFAAVCPMNMAAAGGSWA